MNTNNNTEMNDYLVDHINSWEQKRLVFSYKLTFKETIKEINIVLVQKETNFFLWLSFEENQKKLTVKKFTLINNKQLEEKSANLFEAATLEIVLQALDVFFCIGQYKGIEEIRFSLEKDDANDLLVFASFFHYPIYQQQQVFLTLSTTKKAYEIFNHNNQEVHAKMSTELWKRQKEDSSLTQYLQNQKPIFSLENGNFLAALS